MVDRDRVAQDAHAVFLPAIDARSLPDHVAEHLRRGGTSVLLGETRDEYVARRMSSDRRSTETASWFRDIAATARTAAGGEALVAVDHELGGIQRLHGLVTPLPTVGTAGTLPSSTLRAAAAQLANECSGLGVNVVLSPIVDIVTGPNPWLDGRTLGGDPEVVMRVASAFIEGLQSRGNVAATAKHFPGHACVELDPAVHPQSVAEMSGPELEQNLDAFRTVIDAGARIVMTGPTLVPVIDPDRPASRSLTTIRALRETCGFEGVILSDDLDSPGILRGVSIAEAALDALAAGVDWLLVAGTPELLTLVASVVEAVHTGNLPANRLHEAAAAVRALTTELAGS